MHPIVVTFKVSNCKINKKYGKLRSKLLLLVNTTVFARFQVLDKH